MHRGAKVSKSPFPRQSTCNLYITRKPRHPFMPPTESKPAESRRHQRKYTHAIAFTLFSETAGRLMYRHSRSGFLRSWALTATPACRENPATLPTPSLNRSSQTGADPDDPQPASWWTRSHAIARRSPVPAASPPAGRCGTPGRSRLRSGAAARGSARFRRIPPPPPCDRPSRPW